MNADIARSWILANVIALVVSAVLGLIGYGIRKMLGADIEGATFATQANYVAIETVLTMLGFALYARLTGAVMASEIPAFPRENWMTMHLVLGILAGLCLGWSSLEPSTEGEPMDWDDTGLLIFLFVLFAVGGGLLGAAFGGLQALVLRPVAEGLRLWVVSSAMAASILAAAVLAGFLLLPSRQGLVDELTSAGTMVMAGVIGSVIMLPALRGLRAK